MKNSIENKKNRILCIADHPNWIFNRHIQMLKRFLSDEFEIETTFRYMPFDEQAYDLIYPLEYMLVEPEQIHDPRKYVTGIRSWISWVNEDFYPFTQYLANKFQRVHVVSAELFDVFSPYLPTLDYVAHGVDLDFFAPGTAQASEIGRLILGWAGRRDTFIKGYRDYIQPLAELPGVELKICGFIDHNLTLEEMPDFYNSIDALVCATSFEGSNNTILEAAAMERAIITTSVGTVPELFINRECALIVDRELAAFRGAVEELRDHPELRISLGIHARQSLIEKGWDWKNKAEDFRQFFRSALENSNKQSMRSQIRPIEKKNENRFMQTIQSQNQLLRKMRIGDWIMIYDLNQKIKNLESKTEELDEFYRSETFMLMNMIKNTWLGRVLIRLYQRLKS